MPIRAMRLSKDVLNNFRPSAWALEPEETTFAARGWSNKDMDPVPPCLRTWTWVAASLCLTPTSFVCWCRAWDYVCASRLLLSISHAPLRYLIGCRMPRTSQSGNFPVPCWPLVCLGIFYYFVCYLQPLKSTKAPGPSVHCIGLHYHIYGHGTQRNYWCPTSCWVSRLEQIVIWILV